MTSLREDANVQNTIGHLDTLSNRARTILGSAGDALGAFNDYLSWSVEARKTLRMVLDEESVSILIETTGFRLIHAADPAAYHRAALGDLVRGELEERLHALDAVREELWAEVARWQMSRGLHIWPTLQSAVLDTNTLMLHGGDLTALNWNSILDIRVGQTIALVIPQVAVRELDRLKRSNGRMRINGKNVEQRDLARTALRAINGAFPGQATVHELRGSREADDIVSPLLLMLQLDDLRHEVLADADAEIIDRALTLRPFVEALTLVTGDISMRFRSEHAGLHAMFPSRHVSADDSEPETP